MTKKMKKHCQVFTLKKIKQRFLSIITSIKMQEKRTKKFKTKSCIFSQKVQSSDSSVFTRHATFLFRIFGLNVCNKTTNVVNIYICDTFFIFHSRLYCSKIYCILHPKTSVNLFFVLISLPF